MSIVIATDLQRRPGAVDLIETCKQVADTVVVHTVAGQEPIPGCTNVWDTRRTYPGWINGGLDACEGPALVLNDDLMLTVHDLELLLHHARHADLTVVPNPYRKAVTPISGWCMGMAEGMRLDESYGWYFQDDDLFRQVVADGGRITVVATGVRHDRGDAPRYPAEFAQQVLRDRQLYADRWNGGDTRGIADWIR